MDEHQTAKRNGNQEVEVDELRPAKRNVEEEVEVGGRIRCCPFAVDRYCCD